MNSMFNRQLGQTDVHVGSIVLGAMAFAGWYGSSDDEAGVLVIQRALDAGITLIDTAEVYGAGKSEAMVAGRCATAASKP